ncbi:unnamed protein product [Prorocentrum cordatum]|uniref:Uncharacterized protein n=1 Tax=Prorocentrum cordatum TaxID=2364126 RepID=A0ABN9QP17_9DINO|nr:unnamed protein product [Polarella glacialis]
MGYVLPITTTGVTRRKADGSEESFLNDLDTELLHVVHVRLPKWVELEKWPDSAGHFIDVKIITPLESTYVGICADSTLPAVGVSISASLFPASFHNQSCATKESEVSRDV